MAERPGEGMDWRGRGACANLTNPDLMVGEWSRGTETKDRFKARVNIARALCRTCAVMEVCYTDAVERQDDLMVRAATTPDERRARGDLGTKKRGGRAA